MPRLTKDQILAADDLPRQVVAVPEWGGDVEVRAMTGLERDAWERWRDDVADGKATADNVRARFLSIVVIDDRGEPMFTADDMAALGRKNGRALQRLFVAGLRLSGLGAFGVETAAGNSATPDGAASSSGSPSS